MAMRSSKLQSTQDLTPRFLADERATGHQVKEGGFYRSLEGQSEKGEQKGCLHRMAQRARPGVKAGRVAESFRRSERHLHGSFFSEEPAAMRSRAVLTKMWETAAHQQHALCYAAGDFEKEKAAALAYTGSTSSLRVRGCSL
jgi:hypothetical protein